MLTGDRSVSTEPSEQDQIQSTPIGRMAALAGTGAKVGINYLKHYGKRALTGNHDADALHQANANDVYKTFSQLKGGPLKMAQMLSIDKNLLPPAYADQFSQAQYSAPPLSYPLVVRTFRREFGKAPLELFDAFTQRAAHGASIGQVHKATRGDHAYAVKVQYPGVADSLRSDLRVVKPIALQIMGLREKDVADYFREVEERLMEETNYSLELERSIQLSEACAELPHVHFPVYYPELSSRRVLTMDWIEGLTLDKFADREVPQEDRDRVGQALWDFYHHQVHQLRLFHADPHPGNFLVRDGELCVLDFGCTKRLEDDFYYRQFRFLDPRLVENGPALEAALDEMGILLQTDSPEQRNEIRKVVRDSVRLLARPFTEEVFDFGSPGFMNSIYEMGEQNRDNRTLKEARGARGSAHSIYVNRAYFGLYSLLSRLRARVRTCLPDWLERHGEPQPPAATAMVG